MRYSQQPPLPIEAFPPSSLPGIGRTHLLPRPSSPSSSSRGLLEALPPPPSDAPAPPPSMDAGTSAAEQGPCGSRWQPRGSTAARERRQQPVRGGGPPSFALAALEPAVAGPGWVRTCKLSAKIFDSCLVRLTTW